MKNKYPVRVQNKLVVINRIDICTGNEVILRYTEKIVDVEKGSLTEEQHKGVKDINFNFNLERKYDIVLAWLLSKDYYSVQSRVKEHKIFKQNLLSGLHKEKQIIQVNLPFVIVTPYIWKTPLKWTFPTSEE